jgi:hypothetical protein
VWKCSVNVVEGMDVWRWWSGDSQPDHMFSCGDDGCTAKEGMEMGNASPAPMYVTSTRRWCQLTVIHRVAVHHLPLKSRAKIMYFHELETNVMYPFERVVVRKAQVVNAA